MDIQLLKKLEKQSDDSYSKFMIYKLQPGSQTSQKSLFYFISAQSPILYCSYFQSLTPSSNFLTAHSEGKIHLLFYRENKTYHSRTPILSVSIQHSAYTCSCYNQQNVPFPVSRESYHGSLHPFSFFCFSKYHLYITLIISPSYRRLDQVQKPQFTPAESDSLDLASNKHAFCMFSGDACSPSGTTMTDLQPHQRPTLFTSPHPWVLGFPIYI